MNESLLEDENCRVSIKKYIKKKCGHEDENIELFFLINTVMPCLPWGRMGQNLKF